MRLSRLLFVAAVLLASLSCVRENPLVGRDTGAITLSITIPKGEARPGITSRLGKVVVITTVAVTVAASDMETIEKSLSISADGKTASGSIDVPKGDARTFTIEAKDGSGIVQYSGSTTQDILDDNETVTIITEGHYPSASSISITDFDAQSVGLSWTGNADLDFASYELVRAGTATAIASSSTRESIVTVTNRNTTTYTDDTVSPNTTYYYAVVVWDTEGLGLRSSPQSVQTPPPPPQQFSATGPWAIPDEGWSDRYFLNNSFAPSGAVVTDVEYSLRISDTGDPNTFWCGDYQIYISSSTIAGTQLDDLVYDNLGGQTDGGYDDDAENDSDIELSFRSTSYFNGESPNQYWGVYIVDNLIDDSGQLNYIKLRIYYQVPAASKVVVKGHVSGGGSITMTSIDDAVARNEVRTVNQKQTTDSAHEGAGSSGPGEGVRIEKLR